MPPKPDPSSLLGRRVDVVVDRPLGSRHPRFPATTYPLNYGELPGTTSGDGRPIDAYVLGPAVPLRRATGTVVAVVVREDDREDKLVVSTEEPPPSAEEIWRAISFQERYYRSRLVLLGA